MRVFIASKWYSYEGSRVIGVYESPEAAQAVLKDDDLPEHDLFWTRQDYFGTHTWRCELGMYGGSGYMIEEWEVHPSGPLTD